MESVWVLTREHNDYDQHGEYFVEVYKEKPNFEQLKAVVEDHYYEYEPKLEHVVGNLLRKGGDRIKSESVWFHLKEIPLK